MDAGPPTEDKYLKSKAELEDEMAMLLGGRTAEELIFGDPTTGAANDIERVAEIARAMVTEYGMSDQLGPQKLGHKSGEVFLGKDMGHEPNYSDEMAGVIDAEISGLVERAHEQAREILIVHRSVLDRFAEQLIEKETLDGDELDEILQRVTGSSPTEQRFVANTAPNLDPQPAEQMRAEGLDQ